MEREFEEPLTEKEAAETVREGRPCFTLRRVQHVMTYLSKDGRRGICAYHAPDAAAVRMAYQEEELTFVRVWTAYAISKPPEP